ncbi:hypothetical protein EYF80_011214 [Liparis tanakae]|uniref:Uncharacterized protein n=1 Tax=Liparis tanakae TaxID=230148 RepID=A0A4Z2IKS9_9TELE|nr:hypothetical protein EYF80_011214 [Liparis tanakae]
MYITWAERGYFNSNGDSENRARLTPREPLKRLHLERCDETETSCSESGGTEDQRAARGRWRKTKGGERNG